MYRLLRRIYNLFLLFIVFKNRLIYKLLGVKFGKNLKTFSVFTMEAPLNIVIGDNVFISVGVSLSGNGGIIIGNNVLVAGG